MQTKYELAELACTAYIKDMSPWSIVSAFKKTDIYPVNKYAIAMDEQLRCEPFQGDTALHLAKAV